ncbi:TetR/AcrR family transcriptional regulator [Candidatus Solirubrobacter pratensis]|uniref:TetR/AcrR family transcriptional regulator n=1 Tax=Candidatus Solirubrobacter pratensis TaxID=1298857 RepID=UPI00040FE1BE|nr:TetR/AcrR family transcriptional regulator [Candidatus Solirubrobacter pratensis]
MSRTIGSSAVDTRARILDAARTLFAERGYAGTSMRDLADALGMTKAALYYHFPGKADILLALIEPLLDSLDAIGDHAGQGREASIRAYVKLLAERAPGMIQLMADPSAKSDLGGRLDSEGRFHRLERALAGRDGDVLPVRCAIGAAHIGILSTIAARARAGEPPELAGDEIERVIRASLAAWEAAR